MIESKENIDIPPPSTDPPQKPDRTSRRGQRAMTAKESADHFQSRLILKVETRCDELREEVVALKRECIIEKAKMEVEIERLREIERQQIRLKEIHKSARASIGVNTIAMAVGGAFIGLGAGSDSILLPLGWFLVIVPGAIQLFRSSFDLKF